MVRITLPSTRRLIARIALGLTAAVGSSVGIRAQQQSCVDPSTRQPAQWCAGDVFLGVGNVADYPVLDKRTGLPTFDSNGNPVTTPLNKTPGTYMMLDGNGAPQAPALVDATASGLFPQERNYYTTGCAQDPVSGDLFTTGSYSNVISRFGVDSAALRPGGSFDLGDLTRLACYSDPGVDPDDPLAKCGAPESVLFDKAGNLYVGTVDGTNKLLKFDNSGIWQASYSVPLPAGSSRGTSWIELAADQVTMFYTTASNYIVVFRTDGHPLTESMTKDPVTGQLRNLFAAGVEHLADPVLDPGGVNERFGVIVVKNGVGSPIGNRTYSVRLLPPGDGSGGLLVAVDFDIWRVGLDGRFVRGYIPGIYQGEHYAAVDITPDGTSFWTSSLARVDAAGTMHRSTVFQFHIPTGMMTVGPKQYADDVEGICVVHEYAAGARQPACSTDSADPLCRPIADCNVDPSNAECVASVQPTIAAIANRFNAEGDVVTVADWPTPITVADSTGTTVTLTASTLPLGLSFDPPTRTIVGTISYLAEDPIGNTPYPIWITATNGRGFSSTKVFYWTIAARNAPVIVRAISPSTTITTPHGIDIASPLSLGGPVTIQASDADPCDQTVFDWGPAAPIPNLQLSRIVPADGTCNPGRVFTGVISGTPTADGGDAFPITRLVTVHAIDNKGSDVPVTFTWTLTNQPPIVANPNVQPSLVGVPVSLTLTAQDPNGDAITSFTVSGLPHHLSAAGPVVSGASASLVITGTPDAVDTLGAQVTVTVTDAYGASGTLAFRWPIVATFNHAPDCSAAFASADVWPPDHKLRPVTIAGITDADGDRFAIRITSIRQDEPSLGQGAGGSSVDGGGVGTSTAQVRAERSGLSGGRLYFVGFAADDGKGGVCSGTVTIGVPSDKSQRDLPLDSGLRFDSTAPGVPRVR